MNNAKSHAKTYIGIGVGLFSLSFLASGWNKASLITLAIAFALSALLFVVSLRFKSRWLLRITEHMGNISLSHLVIFLMLYGLAITLIKNNLVLPGLISVCAAYFILARGIGLVFGREFLQQSSQKIHK
jgi:predicted neutral ceramidase superfamily lipid hydrolase